MGIDSKIAVFIPTYNERGNVEELCAKLLKLPIALQIVFLDDNSPDGTGEVLDQLAEVHPEVCIIHREQKFGIGSAHQIGMKWAYENNINFLITMDADFTHLPEDIPRFVENSVGYDVVVGSRYMAQKSLKEWNLIRKLMTIGGHILTRLLLRIKYDASGAYRLYNLNNIPSAVFGKVMSQGYAFFFESLYVLHVNKFKIKEIPIFLPARACGSSKMSLRDIRIGIWRLFQVSWLTLVNKRRYFI